MGTKSSRYAQVRYGRPMKDPRPQPVHRRDYQPPRFVIDHVDLRVELDPHKTCVRARLRVQRVGSHEEPLNLHGEQLKLCRIAQDGRPLAQDAYELTPTGLRVLNVPDNFELETEVEIDPEANTALSGLYRSSGAYCTQCEAEGFRRITYFLDRPDVMARFRTTLVGEQDSCPVLLSNGNRVDGGTLPNGRHYVTWEDPFRKPSYLFALVAGNLRCQRDTFVTASGRKVALEIYVEPQNIDACGHALLSLKKAMAWDEKVYGREYDLDVYMIVAVSDFNMGAMENKGLNVFNAKFVLAKPETATDSDYEGIESVIAHEYFHNWTGNRVTCRDWFQLTLKEGLTVFRDQQFSADMTSAAVKRIDDALYLRTAQFAEDQSPTAHPIRPESYIEMNNFYTVTVYNKGAEVVRMLHTLLGADAFRKGMDLYFERHDGQAVTCSDFVAAMAEANQVDLAQFERWYSQAGTPTLRAEGRFDPQGQRFVLTVEQQAPKGHEQDFAPLHLPLSVGLVGRDGVDLVPVCGQPVRGTTAVLNVRNMHETFVFEQVTQAPTLSMLRGFSAPVTVKFAQNPDALAFLAAHDNDPFSRWDAAQRVYQTALLRAAATPASTQTFSIDPHMDAVFASALAAEHLDGAMRALLLTLPSEQLLAQQQDVIDVDGLHRARVDTERALGQRHEAALLALYGRAHQPGGHSLERGAIDQRQLKNTVLRVLTATHSPRAAQMAWEQFQTAATMTDAEGALRCLVELDVPERSQALAAFYERHAHDPLVVDKWFGMQAEAGRACTFDEVVALAAHPAFTLRNPNRVRSLIGRFSHNQAQFHRADGAAYTFVTDKLLELDASNPQTAARILRAFAQWERFDPTRRDAMHRELGRLLRAPGLSRDCYELATSFLARVTTT